MASLAASTVCSLHVGAQCRQSQKQHSARPAAFVSGSKLAASRPSQQRSSGVASSRGLRVVATAAPTDVGPGKLISRVEIPAFIPRRDLVDQLSRWAMIEIQEDGVANVGMPCKVTAFVRNESLWGFNVAFLKDGVSAGDVRVSFDEEVTQKHEWVGRGSDGFPMLEGNAEDITGKHLEIRKTCDRTVSEPLRQSIRDFCTLLVAAINKYYAFGSCFVDDST